MPNIRTVYDCLRCGGGHRTGQACPQAKPGPQVRPDPCPDCKGEGKVVHTDRTTGHQYRDLCGRCNGKGSL